MKIAIIGDLHFGIKDGSYNAFIYQKHFFEDILKPNLKDVDGMIFLGDIYHHRRIVNMRILSESIKLFSNLHKETKIPIYCVAGNHDLYFRNAYDTATVKDISLGEAFYGEDDYYIINNDCLVVHWKNTGDEYKELFERIKKETDITKIKYIFGHFAVVGSVMLANRKDDNFMDLKRDAFMQYFPNLKKVYSGHFHTPSVNGIVKYIGVPYHLTWSDAENKLGFYILDTEAEEETFVENPFKAFKYIRINENTIRDIDYNQLINSLPELNYKMLYKIIYNGNEYDFIAKSLYNGIINKGQDALLIDENVYNVSDINDEEVNNSVKNIGELIENYFLHTKIIPEGEGKFYYDIFKMFYEEVQKSSENIEIA